MHASLSRLQAFATLAQQPVPTPLNHPSPNSSLALKLYGSPPPRSPLRSFLRRSSRRLALHGVTGRQTDGVRPPQRCGPHPRSRERSLSSQTRRPRHRSTAKAVHGVVSSERRIEPFTARAGGYSTSTTRFDRLRMQVLLSMASIVPSSGRLLSSRQLIPANKFSHMH